ncbi:MAG TPA: hypothetical protein VF226_09155 [Hyphomicrobiaceae bacterium]|jgi:anti-sigma factor RsiW
MTPVPCQITPDMIVDYAAGRLDDRDADVIETAMSQNGAVAAAVTRARQLNSRIGRYFSRRDHQNRR